MSLYDEQIALENEMRSLGIERYHKNVRDAQGKSRESTTLYGIQLMKEAVDCVADGIRDFLKEAHSGKPGTLSTASQQLVTLNPDVAAYLTLKYTIDGVSVRAPLTRTALKLANALEDQLKFDIWSGNEETSRIFKALKEKVTKRTSNRLYRRYNLLRGMSKIAMLDHEHWNINEKTHVGVKLIDILIQTTGLMEIKNVQYRKTKRSLFLQANDATLHWIEEVNKQGEVLHPYFYPCVIPPKHWSNPFNGGYHTEHIQTIPMIKTRNRSYLEEMKYHEMPLEYAAINALQDTRWKVNTRVLDVIQQCWDSGQSWAALPPREDYKVLPSPVHGNKKNMTPEELDMLIKWKKKATRVYDMNAKMTSKRIQLTRTLSMAHKFKDYEAIHFVYQCDFRGRKYTVNSFLTPQGPDYAKALLEFADKKPIDSDLAEYYFKVHGANCFGYDKVSFADRVKWVEKNSLEICESARSPLNCRWWTNADDPWTFLAWAFEFEEFTREGKGYMSSIPVTLDGSNNGLQHFSAMLLDPVGGKATNLTPESEPQDIYEEVAKKVLTKVGKDAKLGEEMAQKWLAFGVDRKITKRPVMVVPYGGTRYSCREYIEEAIQERVLNGQHNPFGEHTYEASMYLSVHVWAAIGEVVVAAREAMAWLQGVGRLMSDKNMPIVWQTPSGFVVQQTYKDVKTKRVATHIDNTLIKPMVLEETDKINKRRATNGLSPNFVHSMDACALTLTLDKCIIEGITDFAVVHDSYGVHAKHVAQLVNAIREAFHEMYHERDLLMEFYDSIENLLSDLTLPPQQGTLDIDGVLKSDYFFS